ncbi:uncharacterized protein LOC62_05G006736 [Vanrija pseudolonga]|uniref:Chromosome transmission fidelity protein 8 n=1 Tax=Vanrija pseudolonga TaxID=143232 RepID=A0AAF0YGR0_9TREE|nr:hypothetical protein LOC62_05G006736 [Vanrija pseudolonga]
MRIHLPLHPHHFAPAPAGAAGGPLARIGGELVVVELQGELAWEGERAGGVVGVLGFDRPDHPTLHVGAHHLLHGKIATLPKPYAVIRRVVGTSTGGAAIEGDAADEESDEEREARRKETPKKAKLDGEEDEDEPPLFADAFTTPSKAPMALPSSSPFVPSSAPRDYSSDLSSPVTARDAWGFPITPGDDDDDEDEEEEQLRAERRRKRRRESKERTRHYEVVGVVRKKVVFALRPEPLVAATQLPE